MSLTEKDIGEIIRGRQEKEQNRKIKDYDCLNQEAKRGQILFTGSSLMEQFPVNELAMDRGIDKILYNRGVGGYTTDDFLAHIDTMLFDLEPSKVFLNIGTNDIHVRYKKGEDWFSHLFGNYRKILNQCQSRISHHEIYLMAFYPVNPTVPGAQNPFSQSMLQVRTNENIARANQELERLAKEYGYHFINVNQGLTDERGNTKGEFCVDGIHMYPNAYAIVLNNLLPYLN